MNHKAHRADGDVVPEDDATQDLCSRAERYAVSQYRPSSVVPVAQNVANSKSAFGAYGDIADNDRSHVMDAEPGSDLGARTDLDVRQDLRQQNHCSM